MCVVLRNSGALVVSQTLYNCTWYYSHTQDCCMLSLHYDAHVTSLHRCEHGLSPQVLRRAGVGILDARLAQAQARRKTNRNRGRFFAKEGTLQCSTGSNEVSGRVLASHSSTMGHPLGHRETQCWYRAMEGSVHAEVLAGRAHSCTVLNHKSSYRKQQLPAEQWITTLLCVMGIYVECTHTEFLNGLIARFF